MAQRGVEWLIEAHGCDAARLCDVTAIEGLFVALTRAMALNPVDDLVCHRFPGAGGITAVRLLSESHLACHTFPEHRSICLNLFCCTARPEANFEALLREHLGAASITLRRMDRIYETERAAEA